MPSLMTPELRRAYDEDGFVIVRGMFDREETDLLRRAMEVDPEIRNHMIDRADAKGQATRIALWNRAGDSVYGMAARCERMVDTMEDMLGGPIYHFQSKLTAKEPFVGGAWEWHQDYGYWYHNGCLFPDMASCQIALDRSFRENGCLEARAALAQAGTDRPRAGAGRGAEHRRSEADGRDHQEARRRAVRAGARRRPVFPFQHAAPLGPEHVAAPPLDAAVLLQPRRQRHLYPRA